MTADHEQRPVRNRHQPAVPAECELPHIADAGEARAGRDQRPLVIEDQGTVGARAGHDIFR